MMDKTHITELGKKNAESGRMKEVVQPLGASLGGKAAYKKHPEHWEAIVKLGQSASGKLFMHRRWHVYRNRPRPDICELCREDT